MLHREGSAPAACAASLFFISYYIPQFLEDPFIREMVSFIDKVLINIFAPSACSLLFMSQGVLFPRLAGLVILTDSLVQKIFSSKMFYFFLSKCFVVVFVILREYIGRALS